MKKFRVSMDMEHKELPAEIAIYIDFYAEDQEDAGLNWWQKPEVVAVTKNLNDAGWWVTNGDPVDIEPADGKWEG